MDQRAFYSDFGLVEQFGSQDNDEYAQHQSRVHRAGEGVVEEVLDDASERTNSPDDGN